MWLLGFILPFLLHPLHVSVTEANYNESTKSLQITSRIFIDDLELSIRNGRNLETLDLMQPSGGLTTDGLVSEYIQSHFSIKLDGKPVKINYLAHETEEPALILYLEVERVKKFRSIEITNTVIQETHSDQSNLVHVTYKGPVKSLRLTREKATDVLKFE